MCVCVQTCACLCVCVHVCLRPHCHWHCVTRYLLTGFQNDPTMDMSQISAQPSQSLHHQTIDLATPDTTIMLNQDNSQDNQLVPYISTQEQLRLSSDSSQETILFQQLPSSHIPTSGMSTYNDNNGHNTTTTATITSNHNFFLALGLTVMNDSIERRHT